MIASLTTLGAPLARRDLVLAALFGAVGVWFMTESRSESPRDISVLAIPLFVLVFLPIAWRRAAPLAAIAASTAALLAHVALFGEVVRCGIVLPFAWVLVFSVGALLPWRSSLVGLGLALASGTAICLWDGPDGATIDALPFVAAVTAAVWAGGCLLRSRGNVATKLAARTTELRDARDRRAQLEVAADRARVSAELDELVQRHLGELAAMAERADGAADPAAAAAAFQQIEAESRRTLDQMRAVVGVLRSDADDGAHAPQPTLTHLEALLLRTRGSEARLMIEGSPRVLPAAVELAAYRIVEHLLDALDGVAVDVAVRFGDDALELSVSGPQGRPNTAAIRRAQERVHLHRGTLRSSTRGGRAEAVASLPILAGA